MCYYPRLILNRKYLPNRKNNYNPPKCTDERLKYVAVGCGNCLECKKQKANEWKTRLNEELKVHKYTYFVTLTISNESFDKICNKYKVNTINTIATLSVRMFLERWRKKYKKSLKHWLITELGEENDRLHLHGFIFDDEDRRIDICEKWKFGNVYIGDYCNSQTINYCVKYALKVDTKHKDYKQIVLASKGIGQTYIVKNKSCHIFNNEYTNECYTLPNGTKVNLPIYYRNNLFSEEERERLWINKLNNGVTYVNGIKIDITTEHGIDTYNRILEQMREENANLGYGDNSFKWKKKDYNFTLKRINAMSRLQKIEKKQKKQ